MRSICFALLVCMCAACGITDFDINQPIPAQTIQGSSLPGPLASIFPIPLSLDISQQIESMDTGPISSVNLKSLELTITSAGGEWSFVQEVDVFVSSTKSGSSLPRIEIAHVSSPGAVTQMQFVVNANVDLNPYINEGSEVDAQGSGQAPAMTVSYDGNGTFTVHPV